MKYAPALFASTVILLLASVQSAATTIVLIRTEDAVYIGADSRIGDQNGESLGTECKISKIGDLFFANAGLGVDAMYGFNIKHIALDILSSAGPFEQKLQEFIVAVDTECRAYLARIKYARNDIYNRIMSGRLNIEAVIAGRDDFGAPFFRVIKFAAKQSDSGAQITTPVMYGCPGDCRGGTVVAMIGQMANIEEIVDKWAFGMIKSPVKAINFLINREIENNKRVGGPITILEIGPEKSTWLQHDKQCLDN